MNNLVKQVSNFIEKNGVQKEFITFITKMFFDFYNKQNDEIVNCYLANPIDFIRLYEQRTDTTFKVEDSEIVEKTTELFNQKEIDSISKWESMTNTLKNNWNPSVVGEGMGMLLFLLFLSMVNDDNSFCQLDKTEKPVENKDDNDVVELG